MPERDANRRAVRANQRAAAAKLDIGWEPTKNARLMMRSLLVVLVAATPTVSPAWGPSSPEGLQLGCWVDARAHVIQCAIRNQGHVVLQVSDYFLGDSASVDVKAVQPGREPLLHSELSSLSAGAGPSNLHSLAPKQFLPKRGARAQLTVLGPAFSIPLKSLAKHDALQVVVTQRLGGDGLDAGWSGTLQSGAFALPR